MQLCYLCREWYSPTAEVLAEYAEAGYDWDHVNWICPGCEEALSACTHRQDTHRQALEAEFFGENAWLEEQARYEDEEDYEHPF